MNAALLTRLRADSKALRLSITLRFGLADKSLQGMGLTDSEHQTMVDCVTSPELFAEAIERFAPDQYAEATRRVLEYRDQKKRENMEVRALQQQLWEIDEQRALVVSQLVQKAMAPPAPGRENNNVTPPSGAGGAARVNTVGAFATQAVCVEPLSDARSHTQMVSKPPFCSFWPVRHSLHIRRRLITLLRLCFRLRRISSCCPTPPSAWTVNMRMKRCWR